MVNLPEKLTDQEFNDLKALVHMNSETKKGQDEKLARIQKTLRDRTEGRDDVVIEEIQGLDDYYSVVASIGDASRAKFRILVPAHIDVFRVEEDWPLRNTLRPSPSDQHILLGSGVHDMLSAAGNSIQLVETLRLKEQIFVAFAFVSDEERKSRGMRGLIKNWPLLKEFDLVLSQEIGPTDVPRGDARMRVTLGRRGNVKINGEVKINVTGHGARSDLLNAISEKARVILELEDKFTGKGKHAQWHPVLGMEQTEPVRDSTDRKRGHAKPTGAEWQYNSQIVLPRTIEDTLKSHREFLKQYGDKRQWARNGVEVTLNLSNKQTSYNPFVVDQRNPIVQTTLNGLAEFSQLEVVTGGGSSVADENLLAAALEGVPVLSVPIIGGGDHSVDEYVDQRDIIRVREAFRFLLEGFFLQHMSQIECGVKKSR